MAELKNIELDFHKDTNKSYNNSELINISNKENDINPINNSTNEILNKIDNYSSSSEIEFKISDKLYGNNYIKYYSKISSSKKCCNSAIKKMGNYYVYFFFNEQPLIVIGDKKKSFVIIYELILQLSFIILMITIKSIPLYLKYILSLIYLNCFFCHMFIYLTNPGIPSIEHYTKIFLKSEKYMKMSEQQKKNYYLCEICNIAINYSEDIEHCDDCDICVEKYDHHCYWTGKCISKKIIWVFYFFVFGTMIYILWYFVVIIYWICSLAS